MDVDSAVIHINADTSRVLDVAEVYSLRDGDFARPHCHIVIDDRYSMQIFLNLYRK